MRGGEFAGISGNEFRKLRESVKVPGQEKLGLTQVQVAILGRSSTFKPTGKPDYKRQARRVQDWEAGKNRIPLASYELICAKIKLLELGLASLRELEQQRLDTILGNIEFIKVQS